jgi:hypothetical protein
MGGTQPKVPDGFLCAPIRSFVWRQPHMQVITRADARNFFYPAREGVIVVPVNCITRATRGLSYKRQGRPLMGSLEVANGRY